jgi:hypothetical protein
LSIVRVFATIALGTDAGAAPINQNRREDANDDSPHAGGAIAPTPVRFDIGF